MHVAVLGLVLLQMTSWTLEPVPHVVVYRFPAWPVSEFAASVACVELYVPVAVQS